MRSVARIEALVMASGSVSITPEEATRWILKHRREPIDTLPVALMAQGYDADNCPMEHAPPDYECDCFTQLVDSDVWEIDELTGKPTVQFAEWWGPFELWKS